MELKILLYTNLNVFFLEILFQCFDHITIKYFTHWISCLSYICPIFSILIWLSIWLPKWHSIWLLTKNARGCVYPSVYDALSYFTETVTPRKFSKIILSHNFLSYSSFCVNTFSKNFLLFVLLLAKLQ